MTTRITITLPDPVYKFFKDRARAIDAPIAETFRRWATAEFERYNKPARSTVAADPKPEPAYKHQQQERELKAVRGHCALYRDERGTYKTDSKLNYLTWADYIQQMRETPEVYRDEVAYDDELGALLARREIVYASAGIEPPPLPAWLTAFRRPHCDHGLSIGDPCYHCDVESGEFDPDKPLIHSSEL